MKIVIAIILLVLIVFVVLKTQSSPGRPGKKKAKLTHRQNATGGKTRGADNPYRAVSIKCGKGACKSAKSVEGKRFLLGRISGLPLPECSASVCNCKFSHHEDRRIDDDSRRIPSGMKTDLYAQHGNTERRERRGRRADD